MNLPQNQQTAQTDWRAEITRLRAVDGWKLTCETDTPRLVPVKGKSPGISGAGWQHKTFTVEQVTGQPGATGCGLVTGPQPTGDSVICIDFDGPAAVHYAKGLGLTTTADFNTWQVRRTDGPDAPDGKKAKPTPGRVKLFYRATPAQAKELGDEFILSHNLVPQDKTTGAKKEALEVFHHKGKQAVVLGGHTDGGYYFWPEGHGPEALKVMPEGMFRLIMQADADAAAATQAAIASLPPVQPSAQRHYSGTLSDDFTSIGRRGVPSTCPICGRPATRSTACSVSPSSGSVWCFHGGEYSAPEGLTSGDMHGGRDGTLYGFVRRDRFKNDTFGGGGHSLFVVHRDRSETVVVPATPQPWTVSSEAGTTTWDTAIGLSEGQPEPEQRPAAEQIVDVEPSNAPYKLDHLLERADGLHEATDTDNDALCAQIADLAAKAGTLDAWAGPAAAKQPSEQVRLKLGTQMVGTAADGALVRTTQWNKWVKKAALATALQISTQRQEEAAAKQLARVQSITSDLAASGNAETWKHVLAALPTDHAVDPDKAMREPQNMEMWLRIADRIRFNVMVDAPEVLISDDTWRPLSPDEVEDLPSNLNGSGYHLNPQTAIRTFMAAARRTKVNPVKEYLHSLLADDTIPDLDLNELAPTLFRFQDRFVVDDQLSRTLLRTWLIGTVKRVLEPGCEMQGMLVLVGEQGCGKSGFFKGLMPEDSWVITTQAENSRDQREVMQRGWITVIEELDGMTGKKDAAFIKNLITNAVDTMRMAYAKSAWSYRRSNTMAATVNTRDWQRDATGGRRFWTLDLTPVFMTAEDKKEYAKHIRETVARLRDSIWKAALLAVLNGEEPFLSGEACTQLDEQNMEYRPESAMAKQIYEWQLNFPEGTYTTAVDALIQSKAYEGDAARLDLPSNRGLLVEATNVLKDLEYKSVRMSTGARERVWVKTTKDKPTQGDCIHRAW